MAPNAQILFQDIGNDQDGCLDGADNPIPLYLQALSGGARIHSDSYGGSNADGTYDSTDRAADQFLFDHEEMALFFAAGNDGPDQTTIGSPANGKNVISVGALGHGNSTAVASFSSRGPTADGRVKPDLMAPGVATVSAAGTASHTDANCGTKGLNGTSFSCPTAAGVAALVREYFAAGFYPTGTPTASNSFEPSAPLVKAVLINGALPLGTFGDGNYGWGRVFLDNNLFFAGDARSLRVWNLANTQGLTTGQSNSYTVSVAAGQEFRATLVWFDPEATPGTAVTLVNNLNLTVSDGTNTYQGNVFNGSGVSVTGGTADTRNSVEHVRLTSPAAGTYTVTVTAAAVPGNGRTYTNRQGYALVVSGAGCRDGGDRRADGSDGREQSGDGRRPFLDAGARLARHPDLSGIGRLLGGNPELPARRDGLRIDVHRHARRRRADVLLPGAGCRQLRRGPGLGLRHA